MSARKYLLLFWLAAIPTMLKAEVSANFGMVSDYVFRGFYQAEASGYAGLDYQSERGFYIGTWAGEVTQGIETDLYFGYRGSSGDFGYGVGYGAYYYTDDFDDTYKEYSVTLSYRSLELNIMDGRYGGSLIPEQDYSFFSLGYAFESGAYVTYGSWGDDFDGAYTEVGYGFDFMGLDLSVALIHSGDLPVSQASVSEDDTSDYNLVFGVSKSISLGN